MKLQFLCDFDGTASPADIGAQFVRRYHTGDPAESKRLLALWRAEKIGSRELTETECREVRVTAEEALGFARGFEIDPGFPAFVSDATDRGAEVLVVSDGFDFYVRDLLDRAGLGRLPWVANHARFEGGRMSVDFPYFDAGCGRCGNCKGAHVREHRARGRVVVLIGDGASDRCGARAADHVLARGDLLEWCGEQGIDALPFRGFEDASALIRRLEGAAVASPRPAAGGR